jgi:hypothetical protein
LSGFGILFRCARRDFEKSYEFLKLIQDYQGIALQIPAAKSFLQLFA